MNGSQMPDDDSWLQACAFCENLLKKSEISSSCESRFNNNDNNNSNNDYNNNTLAFLFRSRSLCPNTSFPSLKHALSERETAFMFTFGIISERDVWYNSSIVACSRFSLFISLTCQYSIREPGADSILSLVSNWINALNWNCAIERLFAKHCAGVTFESWSFVN